MKPTLDAEVKRSGKHPGWNGVRPFTIKDEGYFHIRFAPGMKGVTPILSAIAPVGTVHFKDGEKPSARGGNADVVKVVQAAALMKCSLIIHIWSARTVGKRFVMPRGVQMSARLRWRWREAARRYEFVTAVGGRVCRRWF